MRKLSSLLLCASVVSLQAQRYVVIASEFDSLSRQPPQAINTFGSINQITSTVNDQAYEDLTFSQFTFDGTQWTALSQLSDSIETEFMTSVERPSSIVWKAWRHEMEITDIAFGQGEWILYGKEDSGVDQVLAHTTDFNKIPVLIWERWAEGYVVTEVCYGQGAWGLVFTRAKWDDHPLHGLTQVYSTISGDFNEVQAKIESRWKQGFAITSIATNGTLWLIIGTKHPGIVSQQVVLAESREGLLEIMYKIRQSVLTVTELVGLE